MNTQDLLTKRKCYSCGTEIADKIGKYFCSSECWDEWKAKNPTKDNYSIEEIQKRLIKMSQEVKTGKPNLLKDILKNANKDSDVLKKIKEVFNV